MSLRYGIVLLHHNEPDDLGPCLAAIQTDQRPFDALVLVDNASEPANAAAARAAVEAAGGRFIAAPGNDGFASGNNIGIAALAAAGMDAAIILNPDATLEPGCLDRLVDHLEANQRVGAACPLIVNQDGRVWYAGGRFDRWQGRLVQPGFGGSVDGVASGPVEFVTGCVLALRIEALAEVGLLHDALFIYYEDVELSERLMAAGWGLSLVAEAKASHRRGEWGDPDRHLGPFMLFHTMSSRGAFVRGTLRGRQRWSALAFTPIMVARFAYLVARCGGDSRADQLRALWRGTVHGLRREALDEGAVPRFDSPARDT